MRYGRIRLASFIVSWLTLCATGCICVDRRSGCGPTGASFSHLGGGCGQDCSGCCGVGERVACQSECQTCGDTSGFRTGPLARLFQGAAGWNGCAGGCGELYVDEWISERPTVDPCPSAECLSCGRQPIRSLLGLVLGDRYTGGCETGCCDSGVDLGSPIIHEGYAADSWRSGRGCKSCGGAHSGTIAGEHHGESVIVENGETAGRVLSPTGPGNNSPGQAVPGRSIPKTEPESVPASPSDSPAASGGNASRTMPTPAPPIPKSAMRLNPASRRVAR